MAEKEPWAQLVSLTEPLSDPILIRTDEFSFGRIKGCDKSFLGNKLVSGTHCRIKREDDSSVWLQDSSTNGTLINHSKVLKARKKLQHGDEMYLVYKKNEPEVNIGYMFQDLAELAKEESEQTVEYSSDVDLTDQEEGGGEPLRKKQKLNDETEDGEDNSDARPPQAASLTVDGSSKLTLHHKQHADADCDKNKREVKEAVEVAEDAVEVAAAAADRAAAKEGWGAGAKKATAKDGPEGRCDPYEDSLICTICQDIFYNCVSLQPCLHSFCAGCYSDWMERSRECPTCRLKVERINKNHLVNNLVEVYLKQNPEKKRSDDDMKEQDKKNKISKDTLYPKKPSRPIGETCDDESDYSSHDDSGSDEDNHRLTIPVRADGYGGPFGIVTVYRPPKTVCRQCPEYSDPQVTPGACTTIAAATTVPKSTATGNAAASHDAGEGTSSGPARVGSLPDIKVMPQAPQFACPANQNHILCQCCLQPMPDRRTFFNENNPNPAHPPMQCKLCFRLYCHAYWGCQKTDCHGCIGKLKDLTFSPTSWNQIIMRNQFESQILKKYAESIGMTLRDMLQDCCKKLDSGKYKFQDQRFGGITSNSGLCYRCGLSVFGDLAYQYRQDIPADQLPEEAKNRTDCYWGRNCRTQVKLHHAQRFNHICEQTRKS